MRRLAELYRGRGDESRARDILQRFAAVSELAPASESPRWPGPTSCRAVPARRGPTIFGDEFPDRKARPSLDRLRQRARDRPVRRLGRGARPWAESTRGRRRERRAAARGRARAEGGQGQRVRLGAAARRGERLPALRQARQGDRAAAARDRGKPESPRCAREARRGARRERRSRTGGAGVAARCLACARGTRQRGAARAARTDRGARRVGRGGCRARHASRRPRLRARRLRANLRRRGPRPRRRPRPSPISCSTTTTSSRRPSPRQRAAPPQPGIARDRARPTTRGRSRSTVEGRARRRSLRVGLFGESVDPRRERTTTRADEDPPAVDPAEAFGRNAASLGAAARQQVLDQPEEADFTCSRTARRGGGLYRACSAVPVTRGARAPREIARPAVAARRRRGRDAGGPGHRSRRGGRAHAARVGARATR